MVALIPQIWADALMASFSQRSILVDRWMEEERKQHEQRMRDDPDYAKCYELRQAEDEAMSYWDALYDNQRLEDEEEDELW